MYHAFLWERDRIYDLGGLDGANRIALAVNGRGDIVGQAGVHAVLWRRTSRLRPVPLRARVTERTNAGQHVAARRSLRSEP